MASHTCSIQPAVRCDPPQTVPVALSQRPKKRVLPTWMQEAAAGGPAAGAKGAAKAPASGSRAPASRAPGPRQPMHIPQMSGPAPLDRRLENDDFMATLAVEATSASADAGGAAGSHASVTGWSRPSLEQYMEMAAAESDPELMAARKKAGQQTREQRVKTQLAQELQVRGKSLQERHHHHGSTQRSIPLSFPLWNNIDPMWNLWWESEWFMRYELPADLEAYVPSKRFRRHK